MTAGERNIQALRSALEVSPDNVPLRRMLAAALHAAEEYESAEAEYQRALNIDPDDVDSKLGLAESQLALGKIRLALVLVEHVVELPHAPAAAFVLFAKTLIRSGRVEEAVQAYQKAVAIDPAASDPNLAQALGIGETSPEAAVVDGRVRASVNDIFERDDSTYEHPKTTFADVGGMDAVKKDIQLKIILPLTNQDMYAAYGRKAGGGILLYGPPGCGKTLLARATAGEIRGGFRAVGLQDVLDMWIGQSERQLHEIFEQARCDTPCVLFFDEVDALAASRADMRQSAGRHVINQFLSELDGIEQNNEGILILAATNALWYVDSAFRRPGRFDRLIFVPPPDLPARHSILTILLNDKPTDNVDIDQLAKKTDGFSGADLKAVVERAVDRKLDAAIETGVAEPLTTKDMLKAVKQGKPSTKEWFATARNHALFANEGGLYDDVLRYLKLKPAP